MDFTTRVQGIPCVCKVTFYRPAVAGNISGPPENCYPDEPPEFEFELHKAKGKGRLKWLEAKMAQEDKERLQDEYEAAVTAAKHDIDF